MWPQFFGKEINQKLRLEPADILLKLVFEVRLDLADHAGFLVWGEGDIGHGLLIAGEGLEQSARPNPIRPSFGDRFLMAFLCI